MNNHDKLDCGTGKEMHPLNSYEFDGLSVDDLHKTIARSENYTVRLPKDRCGNTICVGDTVLVHFKQRKVIAVDGKDKVLCYFGDTIDFCLSKDCLLVEPDTQEKIDTDVLLDSCTYFGAELCAECPNFEDGHLRDCLVNKIQDLLRRQRALVHNGIDFANHYHDYKLCKYFSRHERERRSLCLLGPTNKTTLCGAVSTDCYAFEKVGDRDGRNN